MIVDVSCGLCNLRRLIQSQHVSATAFVMPLHTTGTVDLETVGWRLDDHDIQIINEEYE